MTFQFSTSTRYTKLSARKPELRTCHTNICRKTPLSVGRPYHKPKPYKKVICKEDWEDMLQAEDIRKTDMNKVVMNFLVTECYDKAVKLFSQESGTSYIDLEGIQARADIKSNIMCGELTAALNSISKEIQLSFSVGVISQLARQWMIELICKGEMESARSCCQKCADEYQVILDNIGDLMGVQQRLVTANAVNEAILTYKRHEKESNLDHMLKKMVLVQDQVNEKEAVPKLNLSTGTLDDPVEESRSFRARFGLYSTALRANI